MRQFSFLVVSFLGALASVAGGALEGAVALTTVEIGDAFADVRDDAEVQDSAGTLAVNHWYADGTFTNQWRNASGSGEVAGRWWAEDNKRCVVITRGLRAREGVTRCSPVYRRGNVYLSIEPDGSIHGIHRLTPLQ